MRSIENRPQSLQGVVALIEGMRGKGADEIHDAVSRAAKDLRDAAECLRSTYHVIMGNQPATPIGCDWRASG
jgi:hypothetical protein